MGADDTQRLRRMMRRYGDIGAEALERVLCPVLIPISRLDRETGVLDVRIDAQNEEFMVPGRTGKFVPRTYTDGGVWREIAKGRILRVDPSSGMARGEVYVTTGGSRAERSAALARLSDTDCLEVDQYGASAKVLSALVEYSLSKMARGQGYRVARMPEDVARSVGAYYSFDFALERDGVTKRVEVKSLWGTDTRYARLIHSVTKGYETSSCKFSTQDMFAVSLFLRTGRGCDFAFARSVPRDVSAYGLPRSSKNSDYVHQNPTCDIGDGSWFGSINEVWDLP